MKAKNIAKLAATIGVSQLAGGIGSLFTAPSIPGWYATLVKPAINPPSWVFAPVWTLLFILMGIAAFLVWRQGAYRKDVKVGLWLFALQLALNVLWSAIFFGLHEPGWAFVEIIALWLAILSVILAFGRVSKMAAALLVPYILWVTFASYLTYSFWTLNPTA